MVRALLDAVGGRGVESHIHTYMHAYMYTASIRFVVNKGVDQVPLNFYPAIIYVSTSVASFCFCFFLFPSFPRVVTRVFFTKRCLSWLGG